MKKLLHLSSLVCLIIMFLNGNAFSSGEQFRTNASGNWNTLSVWQMSTNNGGTWIAATSPPRDTSGLITVRNPNTVSVTGVVTASSVTIESGASLNAGSTSGSGTFIYGNIINNGTLTAGSTGGYIRVKGPSLVNNGALQANGTIYFDTTTALSGTGTFTPANTRFIGNVTLGNSITYSPSSLIAIENNAILNPNGNVFTFTSGDIYLVGTGEISVNGTVRTQNSIGIFTDPTSKFNAALNVNTGTTIANDDASPLTGRLYGNVTIDAGATLNGGQASGRSLLIYGNIVNNGILTATSINGSVRIKGASFVNNGTLTTAGTIYFDTTTALSGTGTFTPANTRFVGNVTLGNSITYSPSSLIAIENNAILNPNGNVFTFTSGDIYLVGTGEISATGTVRTRNSVGIFTDPTSKFNAALNVNTGTTIANDDGSPFTGRLYGNVTIDAGATLNGGQASSRGLWIYGNIVNNGTLTASSSGGFLRIKGSSLVNNGTLTTAGAIYFDTTTALSGTGTFTPAVTSIYGNVTLGNSITYTPGSYIDMHNSAILNPNGYTFTLTSGSLYLNNTSETSASGTVRTQNNISILTDPLAKFKAALNVNTGTTYAYDQDSPYTTKLYGNVTIDAGATLNGGAISGRNLWIYGNVVNNGTLTASSINGYLVFKGASFVNNGLVNHSGQFYFDSTTALSGTGSFTSTAIFTNIANVTLGSTHQMSGININTGGTFNITNRTLKLSAPVPIVQNGTFTTAGSKIEYNGISQQLIVVPFVNYYSLTLNNPQGAYLLDYLFIQDTLSIVYGDLILNSRVITISTTGYLKETPGNTVTGSTGYITTTRSLVSPSGLNVAGMGAVLTTTANLGSTEIRRGHTTQFGLPLGGSSINRYFDITPATNTGLNATFVFKYDDSELDGTPESSLKLFKSTNSGVNWLYQLGTVNVSTNEITLAGIPSFSRWTADSSGVSASVKMVIQGFYNAGSNTMSMSDTVRAYLRNTTFPYAAVDSAKEIINYISLKGAFQFPNAPAGTYFLQIKHRNAIETWSSTGLLYNPGTTLNRDFSFAANMAFGNNQTQVDASPLLFAFWSGDTNQDGTIDAGDISEVENDVSNGATGYVPTDVNGDDFVDGSDVSIVENNAVLSISTITP